MQKKKKRNSYQLRNKVQAKRLRHKRVKQQFRCRQEKFIEALKSWGTEKEKKLPSKFSEFANYYFENYRKRKVTQTTLYNDKSRLKNHIIPYFKDKRIKDIRPLECQDFIDKLAEKSTKTSNECFSLLNGIFKYAIAQGIISANPLSIVLVERHDSTHGKALTKEEEKILLNGTKGTRYQILFAVALYTGLRPNEYKTARIEGKFIIAKNSKRKNGKLEFKRIPISPMLKPYIATDTEFNFPCKEYMADKSHQFLPGHKLYDLRTTFYTRCEECGVAPPARDEFVGHSRGKLNDAYSDLPDEYLLKEGKKLKW